MVESASSNKLIAKNTILLYTRMLLTMVVSLYTSRVVLAALGFEDYGLYNVVGSIVTMFTFLSSAMGNASGRYITYALGKGNEEELHQVVNTSIMIHWIIAGIILFFAETVGLWLLHNRLVIPEGRVAACEWVYQFSIVACVVNVISIPYNSLVIAHEKMGVFAYISIFVVFMKLLIAYLIQIVNTDRLVLYAFLLLGTVVLERLFYQIYCKRHFPESKHLHFQKSSKMKEMTFFAGWKLFGNLMYIGYTQGVNILLNMFFGPVVNAAKGIATQVEAAVNGFVSNFQLAVRPQITKSYAINDLKRIQELIVLSSKLSSYLLLIFVLPIFLEADKILGLWLGDYPEHTASFLRLLLISLMITPLENPIGIAKDSTGNIKVYSIVSSLLQGSIIIFDYIALKLGCIPEVVFVIQIIMLTVTLIAKFFMVRKDICISFSSYFRLIVFKVLLVVLIAVVLPLLLLMIMNDSNVSFLAICLVAVVSVLATSYFIGLNKREQTAVVGMIKKFFPKKGD